MLTPFGRKLRKYRIDKFIKLKDMANAIGTSSAYLSAVEYGNIHPSDSLITRIQNYLSLDSFQINELRALAIQSKKIMKINFDHLGIDEEGIDLITKFLSKFAKLPIQEKERIKEILSIS